MHHSTLIGDITVLKSHGSEFEMSSTFFVDLLKIDCYIDLEYSAESKKIYDVKYFNQTVVRIEASLKTRDTRQRRRCQNFGQALEALTSKKNKGATNVLQFQFLTCYFENAGLSLQSFCPSPQETDSKYSLFGRISLTAK
uniref:Uncharacterized protein n=1 Tax=Glossina palpalis gambiensis TaxID=67801 RepID=A0A1B0BWV8_9MUSC